MPVHMHSLHLQPVLCPAHPDTPAREQKSYAVFGVVECSPTLNNERNTFDTFAKLDHSLAKPKFSS